MTRLTHYRPFLREPITDMFQELMRPMARWADDGAPNIDVDIVEKDDVYTLRAEMPGVKKEDISIEVDGNAVSITARKERKEEQKEGERVIRQECYWGEIQRSLSLASPVDRDKAQAKFDDGVLTLTLPKRQDAAARKLTIS